MNNTRLDERRETCLKDTCAGFAIMSSLMRVLGWMWEQMNFKSLACSRKRANAFSLTSLISSVRLLDSSCGHKRILYYAPYTVYDYICERHWHL